MQGSILPVTIPPPGTPPEICNFFLLGGLFPTPGHEERDNTPPPGLLVDHKYVVLCSKLISVQKHNQTFWQELKRFSRVYWTKDIT